VKLLDGLPVGRGDGDVQMLGVWGAVAAERDRSPRATKLNPFPPPAAGAEARVARDRTVEGLRGVEAADADPEVIDALTTASVAAMNGLGAVAVGIELEGNAACTAGARPASS
jgi:hypothetical protein